MGLAKRNKVSAEFSMSSLTDIIFLLLIFFMLTANFVKVEPFDLPESDSKTVAPTSVALVSINKKGEYSINGNEIPFRALEAAVRRELKAADNKESATLTIAAEV
ncbi:MAG: biopolymer transporter ExbD, partial [Bacteroidota bacterium]